MLSLIYHTWSLLLAIVHRYPAVLDAFRLAAAGLLFASMRKGLNHTVEAIMRACTMTVYIDRQDEVYDWLMVWALEQSGLGVVRSETTRNLPDYKPFRLLRNFVQELYPIVGNHPQALELGTTSRRQHRHWDRIGEKKASAHAPVLARPAKDKPIMCEYRGYRVRVALVQRPDTRYDCGLGMQLSIFCGTLQLYRSLIAHARSLASHRKRNSLTIYGPSLGPGIRSTAGWKEISTRPLRPWDSVILPEGVKEGLLADAREFVNEKEFYQRKGVPWRRGYLLHGVPGSGKTSLIAAIASKLGLSIYMINLGARDLDDNHLLSLFQDVPPRSILLIEDVDCAFSDRKQDDQYDEDGYISSGPAGRKRPLVHKKKDNSVTLSGLLNALDGVASSEGRLLMCTTNYLDRIDEALSRSGRCDVWVKFEYATKEQAEKLFLHFFTTGTGDTAISTDIWEKPQIGESTTSDVRTLARRFSAVIPEDSVPVSDIQAYLMQYKRRPVEAVEAVQGWVEGGFRNERRQADWVKCQAS